MELNNDFEVSAPIEKAWAVLTDVERIAPCLPGAQLQEVEGDEYRGIVKVKVGPITAQYKGTATITGRDPATRRLTPTGKGRDIRGQGTASAALVAEVLPEGTGSRVNVGTDVQVTGKVAQLGRGIMQDVSARLIDQFVANLSKAEAGSAASAAAIPTAAASIEPRTVTAPDPEPIDLLKVGGGALFSRDLLVGAWMVAVLALLAVIAFR